MELKRHQGALWARRCRRPWRELGSQASELPALNSRNHAAAPCFRGSLWTAGHRTPGADTAHCLRDTHPRPPTPPGALREPQLNTGPACHLSPTHPLHLVPSLSPLSEPAFWGLAPKGWGKDRHPENLITDSSVPPTHSCRCTRCEHGHGPTSPGCTRSLAHVCTRTHTHSHTLGGRGSGGRVGTSSGRPEEAAPTPRPLGLCFGAAFPWTEGGRQDAWAPLC